MTRPRTPGPQSPCTRKPHRHTSVKIKTKSDRILGVSSSVTKVKRKNRVGFRRNVFCTQLNGFPPRPRTPFHIGARARSDRCIPGGFFRLSNLSSCKYTFLKLDLTFYASDYLNGGHSTAYTHDAVDVNPDRVRTLRARRRPVVAIFVVRFPLHLDHVDPKRDSIQLYDRLTFFFRFGRHFTARKKINRFYFPLFPSITMTDMIL